MPAKGHWPKGRSRNLSAARVSAGKAYGHVPGHTYHDVDVVVSQRGSACRCHIVESWGSAQGYDEEHGRREVIGRGDCPAEAVREAVRRATTSGMNQDYLAQAASKAEDAAIEADADAALDAALPGLIREVFSREETQN